MVQPGQAAMLAATESPAGEAMALVVAAFLAQPESEPGVAAFLEMSARGNLPAAEIGTQLALLIRWAGRKQRHVIESLERAARRGAHREVWQVLRTLLPGLFPEGGNRPRAGLGDLVAFAGTVAQWAGARGEIPEVARVAAGRSVSMFARECRHLQAHLTQL
jgi:hypothetical protein